MENEKINKALKSFNSETLTARTTALMDQLNAGKTMKEATGITDEMENEMHVLAKHYYDQGKYGESALIFETLSRIDPLKFNYFYGLASSYHQAEDYINAVLGFFTAANLDPINPMPTYYLADSLIQLNDLEDADHFLDITLQVIENSQDKKYEPLAARCRLIKESIKTKLNKTSK